MNFSSKKSLGQNFLRDQSIINLITEKGNINKRDVVLEVGPGTATSQKKLYKKTQKT